MSRDFIDHPVKNTGYVKELLIMNLTLVPYVEVKYIIKCLLKFSDDDKK